MAASSSSKWFWGIFLSLIFIGLIFIGISFLVLATVLKTDKHEYFGHGDKIAVVEVNDVIMTSDRVVRELKEYREDKSIKAIVLRVNSPGGGVAASQEIYEEVKKVRDSGKPIVVSMASIAASGGYYISCGSNLIVANPGTLTGSIGVIAEFITIKDLADKLGIQQNVFKSGELKDAGNPFRQMNEKDKAYFQDVVDNTFGQFLEVVSRERKINMDTLKTFANGRVFTGLQAKDLKLIDSIGTYEDAIRIAANLAGIKGEPTIVKEHKRFSFFEYVLGGSVDDVKELKDKLFSEPILQYKYSP